MAPNAKRALGLLRILVTIDLVVIALHAVHTWTPYLTRGIFSIARDAGIGEHYQYLKALWSALAFLGLSVARSERAYAFWAACFGWLMLDDAGQLHERLGRRIARAFDYPAALGRTTWAS